MGELDRRALLLGAAAVGAGALVAGMADAREELFESLRRPGRLPEPELARRQRVVASPAPPAATPGRWIERAPLLLPRSEMAWAAELEGRLHLVGGYGAQRVDRAYHHAYDPRSDSWRTLAELPLGANHVGVAALDGRLFAVGGFLEQNRRPHAEGFVWDPGDDRWRPIAPLPHAAGAVALVALGRRLHAVGGAVGDTFAARRSVDWHLAWDPAADRWEARRPLPLARDHTGAVVVGTLLHVVGGRVDSFHTNSSLHHVYDPAGDAWQPRRPLPTPRSGHGAALYRGRLFVMGGEGTERVFGQNEAYDPATDRWEACAPMPTPRHGLGAATLGDAIHVAGGGAIVGGEIQSAVHEAFTLA